MGLRGPKGSSGWEKKSRKKVKPPPPQPWENKSLPLPDRIKKFIETLKVPSGMLEGENFALLPWQNDFIDVVFAEPRVVRQAVLTMPRKNGKTGFVAALCLAGLLGPLQEPRGEIYSAASDQLQSAIVFRMMANIIETDPILNERVIPRFHEKTLTDPVSGSFYKALSAETATKHGLSASLVIYDELAQAKNRDLFDILSTSGGARENPLMMVISTQSSDPNHVLSELIDYGKKVLLGSVDDEHFHAVVYEAPPESDIWDEQVWRACNPSMPQIRSLDEMKSSAEQAKNIPGRISAFRNLYLNQKVSPEAEFLPVEMWDSCRAEIDMDYLRGRECFGGLDLAAVRDLNSFSLYFPSDKVVLNWSWMAMGQVETRELTDKAPYREWVFQGFLETTPGDAVNKRGIAVKIKELSHRFDIITISYDPWSITEMTRLFGEESVEANLTPFNQKFSGMSPAIYRFEELIVSGRLRHTGNPVLKWAFSNIAVETNENFERRFVKSRSTGRIDPIIASLMAIGTAEVEGTSEVSFSCVSL